jgi:DNA mismatch repair protein MutL
MIRVLPAEVVDQIAAGEVIERPCSVVKELVENSLDAGARRIRIDLTAGGTELVRVVDDGSGIARDDLELAFKGHATSKLRQLEDLEHIASYGFRGEALASIGSVSQARIQSQGAEIACAGGVLSAVRPCGAPPGTTVEVRDLFFNTPARRRFLRAAHAERARVQELVGRLALARLDVDWTLAEGGRELLRLPGGEPLRERFARVHGRELARALLPVQRALDELSVTGLTVDADAGRRNAALELLYVNGRLVRERGATAAVRQAYRGSLLSGSYPAYCLTLSLPPQMVDVNVHPAKAEVRFAEPRKVCGLLHEAVRSALQARGEHAVAARSIGGEWPRAQSGLPPLTRGLFVREAAGSAVTPAPAPPAVERPSPNPFAARRGRCLQVRELYLVFEGEQGLVVVDQHALHERVLYERLKRRDAARPVAVQRLLAPAIVELPPVDKQWLLEHRTTLAGEGLLLADFGGPAVAVHGLPAVLGRATPAAVLHAFVRGDGDERPSAQEQVIERFHSMACRGAVMSGDRLGDEEVEALLVAGAACEHPHHCPHGRPTVLTFGVNELERYFRRRT